MKKNELIKLLEEIPGNPDVSVWNGLVGDYQMVDKLAQLDLYKEKVEHIEISLKGEHYRDNNERMTIEEARMIKKQAIEIYDAQEFDMPNHFVPLENMDKWYDKKTQKLVILELGERGKTYSDRLGAISY